MSTNEAQAGFDLGMIILSISPLIGLAGWLFWDAFTKPVDEDRWWAHENEYYDAIFEKNRQTDEKLKGYKYNDQYYRDKQSKLHKVNVRGPYG